MSLYAFGPESRVYHIVLERGNYTVCGLNLNVINLKSKVPTKGSGRYVVSEKPTDRVLCEHCERLTRRSTETTK